MDFSDTCQACHRAIQQQNWQQAMDLFQQALHLHQGEVDDVPLIVLGQHLRDSGRLAEALVCFQAMLPMLNRYHQAQAHGWIAELYYHSKPEQEEIRMQHVIQGLRLRDEEMAQYQPTKRILAFSLFGNNPAYCETAIINAELMPEIYPDWVMRVYHDDSVHPLVLLRLRKLGVELVHANSLKMDSKLPGTFWRFFALEELDCDAVIMRDADSVISEREKILVDEWLASEQAVHIIRDWFSHSDLILAGMWGVRRGLLAGIRAWIEQYLQETEELHDTHADQLFLAHWVWPRVKHCCLHHSSVFRPQGSQWPDTLPEIRLINGKPFQLGSWQLKQVSGVPYEKYDVIFYENNQIMGVYTVEKQTYFEIPAQLLQKIEAGVCQMKFVDRTVPVD